MPQTEKFEEWDWPSVTSKSSSASLMQMFFLFLRAVLYSGGKSGLVFFVTLFAQPWLCLTWKFVLNGLHPSTMASGGVFTRSASTQREDQQWQEITQQRPDCCWAFCLLPLTLSALSCSTTPPPLPLYPPASASRILDFVMCLIWKSSHCVGAWAQQNWKKCNMLQGIGKRSAKSPCSINLGQMLGTWFLLWIPTTWNYRHQEVVDLQGQWLRSLLNCPDVEQLSIRKCSMMLLHFWRISWELEMRLLFTRRACENVQTCCQDFLSPVH